MHTYLLVHIQNYLLTFLLTYVFTPTCVPSREYHHRLAPLFSLNDAPGPASPPPPS